ncbi:MAG TPA: DUF1146 domain-containing protein [Acholeplasmataceae bacterium]|nr:DUF1146 domain-containing protein [Acholeplasmataceae bacterium]
MLELIIYVASLFVFFAIVLRILKAVNLPKAFKANHIWEIKAAYFIISLALAHLLTEVILRFVEWSKLLL